MTRAPNEYVTYLKVLLANTKVTISLLEIE